MFGLKMKFATAILFALVFSSAARAVRSPCPPAMARDAASALDRAQEWNLLYDWYAHFVKCDIGDLRIEFSRRVSLMLTYGWSQVPHLAALANFDKRFQRFLLEHIDSSIPDDRLQLILHNARSDCPSRAFTMCQAIGRAAESASGQ
jgi:hypothetical protein